MRRNLGSLLAALSLLLVCTGCPEEEELLVTLARQCQGFPADDCGSDRLKKLPCPHDACDSTNNKVDCPLAVCRKTLTGKVRARVLGAINIDGDMNTNLLATMSRRQNIAPGHSSKGGPATCPARYVDQQVTYDASVTSDAGAGASVAVGKVQGGLSGAGAVLYSATNQMRCHFANHPAPLECRP